MSTKRSTLLSRFSTMGVAGFAVTAIALVTLAGPASASTAPASSTHTATSAVARPNTTMSPNDWDYFGHFDTSDECNAFGQNGQNDGAWPSYECDFDWFDWDYDLYVWVS